MELNVIENMANEIVLGQTENIHRSKLIKMVINCK